MLAQEPRTRTLWEPPEWNVPDNLKATVAKEMLSAIRVSNYQIVLEQTNMEDVRRNLGGQIGRRGDAGDALRWLCYHGVDGSGGWILWLESGEIDGDSVGSFQWQRLSSRDVVDSRCQTLRKGSPVIELPLFLKLGGKSSEVLRNLGAPTSKNGEMFIYIHEHAVGGSRADPFVSSNIVIVHLRNQTLWLVQASRTTSD